MKQTLYKKDVSGSIRVWKIISEPDYGITIEHGTLHGEMQIDTEIIDEGKAGRKIDEQIELRINLRIKKKIDSGYCKSIEEAEKGKKNRLGLLFPMLAQKISDKNIIDWNSAFIQRKYDGHRCIITKQDGEVIAYSRGGQIINSIPEITEEIQLKEGEYIDGELYIHGMPLQKISSLVRKRQKGSEQLKFIVYDCILPIGFKQRYENVLYIIERNNKLSNRLLNARTYKVYNYDAIFNSFNTFKKEGFEGAILRNGNFPYEDGKRSKSLLKIKSVQDSEFIVIDIERAKDLSMAILICKTNYGKEFRVSAPGTIEQKVHALYFKDSYVGKYVRVEYQNLTIDGIPFHPVATNWVE